MKMKWSKQKCRKVAFVFSFCYVLLGTFIAMITYGYYAQMLGFTSELYNSFWYWALFFFTLPVSWFVMMCMFATTSVWAIIIPAVIMLSIIWCIVYWILKQIKMK